MYQQEVLFAPRFLEKYVGKAILSEPKVAIMELIANAWDAGATDLSTLNHTQNNRILSSRFYM